MPKTFRTCQDLGSNITQLIHDCGRARGGNYDCVRMDDRRRPLCCKSYSSLYFGYFRHIICGYECPSERLRESLRLKLTILAKYSKRVLIIHVLLLSLDHPIYHLMKGSLSLSLQIEAHVVSILLQLRALSGPQLK